MTKLPLFLFSFFFCILTVSAAFGYDNPNKPAIDKSASTGGSSVNYSTVNVNNSQFLQGYTPQQVADLYVETDPIVEGRANQFTEAQTITKSSTAAFLVRDTSPIATYQFRIDTTSGQIWFNNMYFDKNNLVDVSNITIKEKLCQAGGSCYSLSELNATGTSFNNTNLAYLNNTQTFTRNNTFNGVINFNQLYNGYIWGSEATNGWKLIINGSNGKQMFKSDSQSMEYFVNSAIGVNNEYLRGRGSSSAKQGVFSNSYLFTYTVLAQLTPTTNLQMGRFGVQMYDNSTGNEKAKYFNEFPRFDLVFSGTGEEVRIPADNVPLKFGLSDDAEIYYDGTDFIINPKAVGSGELKVTGNVNITGNLTAGNTLFVDSNNGRVGIKTSSPEEALDFGVNGNIKVGVMTDDSAKAIRFLVRNYDIDAPAMQGFRARTGVATGTYNIVEFGGGASDSTYATILEFFTGAGISTQGTGNKMLAMTDGNFTEFNPLNLDIDVSFQGDTNDNVLYIDAGNERVGIGTSNPSHDLNVVGNANITGNLTVGKYERHIQIPVIATGLPANQPTPVDVGTAGGFQFASSGTQEELHFQWEVPDDWIGNNITIEIDWLPDSGGMTNPDAVKWVFEYRSIAQGESLLLGTQAQYNVTYSTTTSQYVTVHSPVTLAFNDANQPLNKQDHIYVRVYRDTTVANDFAGTVVATAFEILYDSNKIPTT